MVSIFNGASLTSLKPIFDVIEKGAEQPFQLQITPENGELLYKHMSSVEKERFRELVENIKMHRPVAEHISQLKMVEPESDLSLWKQIKLKLTEIKFSVNKAFSRINAIEMLKYTAMAVVPVYFLKLLAAIGTVYFIASTGLLVVRDMRAELYNKITTLPVSYYIREKTGILMSRIINDVTVVSDSISNDLRVTINNFFIILTHSFILMMISFELLAITLIGVPLVLWPVSFVAKKVKNLTTGEQTHLAELNGHLQEVISGIRVIRAFSMEDYESGRFSKINDNLFLKTFKYRFNHTLGPAIVEFTTTLIVVGLLIYGGARIVEGDITAGSFFLFLFTLMIMLSPIKQIAGWVNNVNRTAAAGDRIQEIMNMQPEIIEADSPVQIKQLQREIKFENVCFQYPDKEEKVLQNINLTAPCGTTTALVGHSGAGKSTMVDLIPRFYDPVEGRITYDGIDIREVAVKDLRSRIGIVTQDVFLFNGTIRDNIAYGRSDIPFSKIKDAAASAFAEEFISQLPEGYDTVIGERGLMLSGGQRQRLSIARALLKNPEILILDEATSALDTESERLVQRALETLMKDRTTFVIAHRLSTVFAADNIVVLDAGRIAETGTHSELLNKNGIYRKLYNMQFNED